MPQIPWNVNITPHPGSSDQDLVDEPDWESGHEHHVGLWNNDERKPGYTHEGDDVPGEEEQEEALAMYRELKGEQRRGDLINFRDVIEKEKDVALGHPENRVLGSRYLVDFTEDYIKNEEDWPANLQKRKKEEEQKKEEDQKKKDEENSSKKKRSGQRQKGQQSDQNDQGQQQEHEWKRQQGENKHNEAYASGGDDKQKQGEDQSEYEKLRDKYSPQEIALLRMLQWESASIKKLKQNDGKGVSPVKNRNRTTISLDEADQFTPDNWIPRSSDLIRLTGKHPLNAEAQLSRLFDAGLITPNELHYVRCHGAVPYIVYEYHKLQVDLEGQKPVTFSMNDITTKFDSINIPVALACDGNRRKELSQIRKVKGFAWGAGAVSCAYWKGALLRDVLIAAGIPAHYYDTVPYASNRCWVHFEGADEPSEGKYSTCIPLQYAMDPTNDVILAYEMNNQPLPPDHGYPLRLMIPGYVGGRCVKWLSKIWVNQKENDSYYHIWDNRVLPSFITEKDGEFSTAMFQHPDTACNEQNLNSVITKPAQGERIPLKRAQKGKTYRIEGYAYDGGGHEVQRVEVSLDDGQSWLYCIRKFPDAPIRHGNKFWTWLHWHVDIEITHLLQAKSIICRCFNVFKNTQPRELNWNVMGMMNNAWYQLKTEITTEDDTSDGCILFRHPCEPGTGPGGWMKPSVENKIEETKRQAGTPQKQFTREEIEKHGSQKDCWIVVDGKVYDATSVLDWHPGGSAAILGHGGKVHQETSDEFASIHDDYAYQKLKECVLGVVSEKAASFIKQTAQKRAKELAEAAKNQPDDVALQKHRWVPVTLQARREISKDTRAYTFKLPKGKPDLGLGTCQHVQIGFHFKDRMIIRAYTPTAPLLSPIEESGESGGRNGNSETTKSSDGSNGHPDKKNSDHDLDESQKAAALRDAAGTFELTVKTYFPTDAQPGGALSNILDTIPIGEQVELRGPTGDIVYHGFGNFTIEGRDVHFDRVSLVLGGSGITPGYALIARVLLAGADGKTGRAVNDTSNKSKDQKLQKGRDKTQLRVIDANKSEGDILLREEMDDFAKKHPKQLKITHVLSHPSDDWKGNKGHVDADLIRKALFPPTPSRSSKTDADDDDESEDEKNDNDNDSDSRTDGDDSDSASDTTTDSDEDDSSNAGNLDSEDSESGDAQGKDAIEKTSKLQSVVFLCGPPAMIQKAALPALKDWGYEEDKNCFGF